MLPGRKYKIKQLVKLVLLLILLISNEAMSQTDVLSSQYMNSQLMINPAYAGVRNAFSVNVLSRQQWVGIKDAPATYAINAHSPLNKRMASLGASVLHYQYGPIQSNALSAIYSYLIRLNHNMFLSLGMNAQISHYNIGLSSLKVIEDNDPGFSQNIENSFKPNFGAGAFMYSPQFYFGVSMPQILNTELTQEETGGAVLEVFRTAYITSGYAYGLSKNVVLKPSFLARLRTSSNHSFDINLQMMYKNLFWVGTSYRTNSTFASLLNVHVSESMAICYSYDFSTGNQASLGSGSHEISLTFDTNSFLRRNRDRRFNRKKVTKKDVDKGMQSIRYF